MRRGCTVLALALLTAAVGQANDNGTTVPESPQPVPPPNGAHPEAGPSAPCGGGPASCGRANCWQRLWGWMTYRPLPAPACCKTCCNHVPYCPPQPYTFFLHGPGTCGAGCHPGYHGNGHNGQPGCHGNGHAANAAPAVAPAAALGPAQAAAPAPASSDNGCEPGCANCAKSCGPLQRLLAWRPGQLLGCGK